MRVAQSHPVTNLTMRMMGMDLGWFIIRMIGFFDHTISFKVHSFALRTWAAITGPSYSGHHLSGWVRARGRKMIGEIHRGNSRSWPDADANNDTCTGMCPSVLVFMVQRWQQNDLEENIVTPNTASRLHVIAVKRFADVISKQYAIVFKMRENNRQRGANPVNLRQRSHGQQQSAADTRATYENCGR